MDLSLTLWIGGMMFTLGVFATKVGLGLGFGRVDWRGVLATHLGYVALFLLAAVLAEPLTAALRPVLRAGPYVHAGVALFMIGWGMHVLRGGHADHGGGTSAHSLILLLPCPVCFSAVVFSTWTALEITELPPLPVGLGLGVAFVFLSSVLHLSVWLRGRGGTDHSSRFALGLTMMAVGAYFLGSLVLPAKIQQARQIHGTFVANNAEIESAAGWGVWALLAGVVILGYLARGKWSRADAK
jgi:predicted transporter